MHLTQALEQRGDKEVRAKRLEMAMANLQSIVDSKAGGELSDGIDKHPLQDALRNSEIATSIATIGTRNASDRSKVFDAFVKESFASNAEIVKQGFKDVIAALYYALEADEETDYVGRRLKKFYDYERESKQSGQPAWDVDLFGSTQESLVTMLNGVLGEKAPSHEAILNLVSVIMAFPGNFVIEFGKFLAGWKLHHTTCLKNPESTAQMEAALFIDYMARVQKEQRADKKAEEAEAAEAATAAAKAEEAAAAAKAEEAATAAKAEEAAAAAKSEEDTAAVSSKAEAIASAEAAAAAEGIKAEEAATAEEDAAATKADAAAVATKADAVAAAEGTKTEEAAKAEVASATTKAEAPVAASTKAEAIDTAETEAAVDAKGEEAAAVPTKTEAIATDKAEAATADKRNTAATKAEVVAAAKDEGAIAAEPMTP